MLRDSIEFAHGGLFGTDTMLSTTIRLNLPTVMSSPILWYGSSWKVAGEATVSVNIARFTDDALVVADR